MGNFQLKEQALDNGSDNYCSNSYLWCVALTSALTAFHFGYGIASINAPSTVFLKSNTLVNTNFSLFGPAFRVSEESWGLVGMGLPLGGWIGGFSAPSLIKWTGGLKPAILSLNYLLIPAYLIMALAINLPMLILGRILIGFVAGASSMMVPRYLSSISTTKSRGFFTNFFQLFLCGGIVIAEIVSLLSDVKSHERVWRLTFGAGLLVVVLQTVLDLFMGFFPNSPTDLESSNPGEAAIIRNKLGIISEPVSMKDSDSISATSIPEINNQNCNFWDLVTFRIPEANLSLILGVIIHAGQQVSGVNAVFFYSTMINSDSKYTSCLLALINFAMTFVAIWLLDRAGRRPVALFSVSCSALCLLALALTIETHKSLAALLLIAFVAVFAIGLGPIPWMLIPEIFPSSWPLTPSASAICVSANWITNILVTGSFPSLLKYFPLNLLFLTFGLSSTLLFFFLFFTLPETKNKVANFI